MAELRGLPRRDAVLRASEVLFQVGLEEERSRLIRTFSTGMKQRAKLAQALVHSPELVVLDEPTNGLDPSGREEMLAPRAAPLERARHRGAALLARARGRHQHLRRGRRAARRAGRHGGAHRRAARASPARACWCAATGDARRPSRRGSPRAGSTAAPPRRRRRRERRRRGRAARRRARRRRRGRRRRCASCARPAGPWRTPSWTRSSEHLRTARGARRRRRDPRRPLRALRRASGAAARPAVMSLARWGALRSLGARRGWKAKAVPDHADPAGGRAGRDRAGRAGALRRPERHRPHRRAAVLGLPGDHRRGDPALRRDHHAGAALPRPPRRRAAALLLDRRQPGRVPGGPRDRGDRAAAAGDAGADAGALRRASWSSRSTRSATCRTTGPSCRASSAPG